MRTPAAEQGPVSAQELEELLAELTPIGLDGDGATTRLAWSEQDEQARAWFRERAARAGLRYERDSAGNLWALPAGEPPWWAVGSHLDTVVRGGRYDGALGVAAAFAVAAREPVAVISFADEEGARFNTPTFGSRALAGILEAGTLAPAPDAEGVSLSQALEGAGLRPQALGKASKGLARLAGFIELHVDQTLQLERAGRPLAVVSRLAARMRLRAQLRGRADHAGTTFGCERHDALAAAARLILAGGQVSEQVRFTAGRIEVEPNAASTVPARARLWLDARAAEPDLLVRFGERFEAEAERAARDCGVELELRRDSFAEGCEFSHTVRGALLDGARRAGAAEVGETLCWAGHDAGILAPRVPAGMLLVRNPSGISHAPQEAVSLSDAALGAQAIVHAVRELRGAS